MADDEIVSVLKGGPAEWNKWRKKIPLARQDLYEADLSEASLQKDWVIREIDEAIANENSRGRKITFPIMLNDVLLNWKNHRRSRILGVLAADLRGATDGGAFDRGMERLLAALRSEKAAT